MYIKLLLLTQLLAFSCLLNVAKANEEETTTTEPVTTTTQPEIVPVVQAAASPDQGFLALDQGSALSKQVAAEPETTSPPVETTTVVPTTTEKPEKLPAQPTYPQPYPGYPYGYGPSFNSENSPKPKPGAPGYPDLPHLGYPILRSPYSPYGSPYGSTYFPRHPQFPGFAPPRGYGIPPSPEADAAEKPKADEKSNPTEEKEEEEEKQPAEPPSFGYPPYYVIQRRPLLPSYPYAVPARGYGLPFGYSG